MSTTEFTHKGHTITVGPNKRADRSSYHSAEHDVLLDGTVIGYVYQYESTTDVKPRGARVTTRRYHPTKWRGVQSSDPTRYCADMRTRREAIEKLLTWQGIGGFSRADYEFLSYVGYHNRAPQWTQRYWSSVGLVLPSA